MKSSYPGRNSASKQVNTATHCSGSISCWLGFVLSQECGCKVLSESKLSCTLVLVSCKLCTKALQHRLLVEEHDDHLHCLTQKAPACRRDAERMSVERVGQATLCPCHLIDRYLCLHGWHQELCVLDAGDQSVVPAVVAFLKSIGRMKYLRPLYKALYTSSFGRQIALDTFQESRHSYHPVAVKVVSAVLEI